MHITHAIVIGFNKFSILCFMSRKNCRINFADVKKNVWKNLKQMVNFKIIWQILPKGQIISEVNCGVLKLPKKTTKSF